MKKYFIGYLIEGEAATWHIDLARNISEKFNTWKLHEKIPPHVTIYYPFETEDINPVKTFLGGWTKGRVIPGNLVLSGFDHFDDRVIFANVEADQVVINTAEELRRSLGRVIRTSAEENLLSWHPHATLANRLTPQEINQIWDYVLTFQKPSFVLPFDNVTIFRSESDRRWVTEESYRFKE